MDVITKNGKGRLESAIHSSRSRWISVVCTLIIKMIWSFVASSSEDTVWLAQCIPISWSSSADSPSPNFRRCHLANKEIKDVPEFTKSHSDFFESQPIFRQIILNHDYNKRISRCRNQPHNLCRTDQLECLASSQYNQVVK